MNEQQHEQERKRSRAFWRGFVVALAIHSLYQDILGKEDYIQRVQDGWVDWRITVPIVVVGLFIVARSAWKDRGEDE